LPRRFFALVPIGAAMPEALSEGDYETLDNFVRAVLERLEAGDIDADDAHADIMHVPYSLGSWEHRAICPLDQGEARRMGRRERLG
jgi:hypothetical protein